MVAGQDLLKSLRLVLTYEVVGGGFEPATFKLEIERKYWLFTKYWNSGKN